MLGISSNKKEKAVYALTIIFSILFIVIGNKITTGGFRFFDPDVPSPLKAKVDSIVSSRAFEADPLSAVPEETLRITFEATLKEGLRKGEKIQGLQISDSFTPSEIRKVEAGDNVLLFEIEEADEASAERWVLLEFVRTTPIYVLLALFSASLLLFGGLKGFNTIVSLSFTCLAVFGIFIPSVLSGGNIYLSSSIVCLFTIAMTLLLVNGPNMKSLAACLGCVGGVAVTGLLLITFDVWLKLTGLVDEQSIFLLYFNPDSPISLKAVIFSSIIVGAMGATLDVSVSIASSISEVCDAMPHPTLKSLFNSGMNIGRDIMGTMANTLVLAYIGSSLSIVLLLLVNSSSFNDMVNREIIIVEILRALTGSIGLLSTIPLTSALSAYVYTRTPRKCE